MVEILEAEIVKTLAYMAIPLSQGLFALVDGEDYSRLIQRKWYAHKHHGNYYARCHQQHNNKEYSIAMHREILGLLPQFPAVDHINKNGLDNRKANLRTCTNMQNQQNRKVQFGTSLYKGVHWNKNVKKWEARITHNKQLYHLAYCDNQIDAAHKYDQAAKQLFGEFAYTNF